jgi:hypothetical protein
VEETGCEAGCHDRVRRIGGSSNFKVIVREGRGETRHQVMVARETCDRAAARRHAGDAVSRLAFWLLLDRELKESIVGRFDLTVISRLLRRIRAELARYLELS